MKYKIVPEVAKWCFEDDKYIFALYKKSGFFSDWKFVWSYDSQKEAEAGIERDMEYTKKYRLDLQKQKIKEQLHLTKKVIYRDAK